MGFIDPVKKEEVLGIRYNVQNILKLEVKLTQLLIHAMNRSVTKTGWTGDTNTITDLGIKNACLQLRMSIPTKKRVTMRISIKYKEPY